MKKYQYQCRIEDDEKQHKAIEGDHAFIDSMIIDKMEDFINQSFEQSCQNHAKYSIQRKHFLFFKNDLTEQCLNIDVYVDSVNSVSSICRAKLSTIDKKEKIAESCFLYELKHQYLYGTKTTVCHQL